MADTIAARRCAAVASGSLTSGLAILLGLIFILIVYLLPNGLVGAVAQLRRRA